MFEEVNDDDALILVRLAILRPPPLFLYNRSGLDDSAGNLWKFAQGCQINASAGNSLMISRFIFSTIYIGAGERNDVDQQTVIVGQC